MPQRWHRSRRRRTPVRRCASPPRPTPARWRSAAHPPPARTHGSDGTPRRAPLPGLSPVPASCFIPSPVCGSSRSLASVSLRPLDLRLRSGIGGIRQVGQNAGLGRPAPSRAHSSPGRTPSHPTPRCGASDTRSARPSRPSRPTPAPRRAPRSAPRSDAPWCRCAAPARGARAAGLRARVRSISLMSPMSAVSERTPDAVPARWGQHLADLRPPARPD